MRNNCLKKIFIFLFCLFNIFLMNITGFCSESKSEKKELIAIAHGGNSLNFPENSLLAFMSVNSAEVDGVSFRVRTTSDGVLIVFEDENTERMCVDKNGNAVNMKISETTYDELLRLSLRVPELSSYSTENKIPKLYEVLRHVEDMKYIIIDVDNSVKDKVYNEVKIASLTDKVYFRFRDEKNKDAVDFKKEKNHANIIAYSKGNMIFSLIKQLNYAKENDFKFIEFATKNPYGVMFGDFFTKRFENINVIAFTGENGSIGKRPDNIDGWKDLADRGFNVIESDNIISLIDFKKSYENNNIGTDLFTKKKKNDGEKGIFKITSQRIFWIIFALILFVSSQIYIFKKTDKSNKIK